MEFQCKNCGTPIRTAGFCSWVCKREYTEGAAFEGIEESDKDRKEKIERREEQK